MTDLRHAAEDADPPADRLQAALAEVVSELPEDQPVACTPAAVELVERSGRRAVTTPFTDLVAGAVSAALLVDDEVSLDGDRAEEFIARATDAVRPAGIVVFTARAGGDEPPTRGVPAARESPHPRTTTRRYDAEGVEHLLLHRGLTVLRLERHDSPDGADRFLVVGRAPVSTHERSMRFIASLPFKLVTAAVVCRDEAGRVLCVFDSFRRHWTIPGGVVDAQEDPRSGAVREAFEEAGVRVRSRDLLGVFQTAVPDRLLMIYAAEPVDARDPGTLEPHSRQPQEIGDVRWLPVDEALATLNPRTRWQVQQCLDAPGETWRE